jgi:hypothetical protein
MKQVIDRLSVSLQQYNRKSHTGLTVAIVLLFLVFWCVSFYVLINSYA